MFEIFQEHIENHFPEVENAKLLLAVSGGIDSIVLVHLLHKLQLDFAIAHCNFNLRGAESDGDEAFVESIAKEFKVNFFVERFPTKHYAQDNKLNTQLAARELRYCWFNELLSVHKYDYVLTAHHADDALETFIINLSRGTGLEGLNGIPEKTKTVLRPLLPFSRKDIENYAMANQITWREDSSNQTDNYLRNKIRHQIAPVLKELHPTFLSNFKHTQQLLQQNTAIINREMQELKSLLFIKENNNVLKIPIQQLLTLSPLETHLYYFFKDYGFKNWGDIAQLLTADSGKKIVSKTHELHKDRLYLFLRPIAAAEEVTYTYTQVQTIKYPIHINIEEVDNIQETSNTIIYVDKEKLNLPLVVRKWNTGDYFYPFGMLGKKKISKFFKDEKYAMIEKESQWLLCANEDIVWIVGKRADQRFAVTHQTKTILKIQLITNE